MTRDAASHRPAGPGNPPPRTAPPRVRLYGLATVFAFCSLGVTARATDIVIFKDGFKIQGRKYKEMESFTDSNNEVSVRIPAKNGFDIVDDGVKSIIFSSNTRQVAAVQTLPDKVYKGYTREVILRSRYPLPPYGEFKPPPFDNNWKRTIEVKTEGKNFQRIEQRVAGMLPNTVVIPSTTHSWEQRFYPRELGYEVVRALLTKHPDLVEPDGKPDLGKRLDLLTFMKDAGFVAPTKDELEKLKAVIPGAWPKDQADRYEALRSEVAALENTYLVDELEAALSAGRYQGARAIIARLAWAYTPSEENNKVFGQRQSYVAGAPKEGVQFMVKDSKRYAATGGWGFAQFNDGKPADEAAIKACFSCHVPAKEHDFVFTRYAP